MYILFSGEYAVLFVTMFIIPLWLVAYINAFYVAIQRIFIGNILQAILMLALFFGCSFVLFWGVDI